MFHHQQRQISPKSNKALQRQKLPSSKIANEAQSVVQRAKADPSSLNADDVLTLQETIGNRAASRLLAGRSATQVQAKLTIGEPGDKYEQEADRVASQVVKQLHDPASAESEKGQSVQRQEESEEEIQAKPSISDIQRSPLSPQVQREAMPAEEELQAKSILQRGEAIAVGEASTDLDTAINSARGGGQPLEEGLQRSMGQAMGADFSGVRVHTDSKSDQLNQSIQAKAFTTGQDMFFRQGAYQPGSRGGQELIAHELTHVVQQKGGAVQRSPFPNKMEKDFRQEIQQANEASERTNYELDGRGPYAQGTMGFDEFINRVDMFKWIFGHKNGLVVISPTLKHSVAAGGGEVITAGHGKKTGERKIWINNDTGHYQTTLQSLNLSLGAWQKVGYEVETRERTDYAAALNNF